MDSPIQPIWHDRKRILGMPITFTKYAIRENKLVITKGLFTTVENEILLYRILDFKLIRTLLDKICGVGTIVLYTADSSDRTFNIEKIKNASSVKEMLGKIVEEERAKAGIKGREIYGVADSVQ
ncbi:MAG: PH domain-containing protein [Deltaproteobacteria bacterium]